LHVNVNRGHDIQILARQVFQLDNKCAATRPNDDVNPAAPRTIIQFIQVPFSVLGLRSTSNNEQQKQTANSRNGKRSEAWRWFAVRAVNTRRQRPHVHSNKRLYVALRPDLSELAGADRNLLVGKLRLETTGTYS